MDFTFDDLKQYLDKRFAEFEARFMQEIGSLRQEMHNGFAAVANTIATTNNYLAS